ncbi:MAG: MarR family winged helix-turn-helix transcriptional regulator [Solirubrobacteraceae bacterium]
MPPDSAPPALSPELPARLRAAIGRLARRLRHTAASSGLTPSEISVLLTIVRHGPLGLSQLAEIEAINPTMLSRITGRLARLGLIEKHADPADRRAARVEATLTGQRMREHIHRERTEVLEARLLALSTEEREMLAAALPVLELLAERVGERVEERVGERVGERVAKRVEERGR